MPKPLLRWQNLKVCFPELHTEAQKLTSESIMIPDGELWENDFLWIDGPSGTGKSTLMHLIKGLIPRYIYAKVEGTFLYEEKSIVGDYPSELDQKTVYSFQNPYSQIVTPRCREEIIFSMENYGFSREEIENNAQAWARRFRLTELLDQKTYTLSGGQCQRLVLASSLACSPKILLFDEPTAFMDPQAQKDFYNLLKNLKGKFTIVVIDHNAPELSSLCDKRLVWPKKENEEFKALPALPSTPDFEMTCEKLAFSYPEKSIFKNMNFKARAGKIISVIGDNGSGKTTFFKLLTGMLRLSSGKLDFTFQKKNLSWRKRPKHTSIIYQNSEAQFYFDTVREELTYNTRDPETHIELAKRLGLENALDRSPYMLSEGQKRRLSILIAIAQEKPLILYDEPTYGQDRANVELITEIMMALKKANRLQILNTHDVEWAKSISDEVYILEEQKLVRL